MLKILLLLCAAGLSFAGGCGQLALNPTTGLLDCVGSSSGGSGTVTSVSFTGGLISVANPTTTPALTVAGTSGGIPYFSAASAWASSGAGVAGAMMTWGGAGATPTSPLSLLVTGQNTNAETWTFYNSTASSGVTKVLIKAGATGGYMLQTLANDGTPGAAFRTSTTLNTNAVETYLSSVNATTACCNNRRALWSEANFTVALDGGFGISANLGQGSNDGGAAVDIAYMRNAPGIGAIYSTNGCASAACTTAANFRMLKLAGLAVGGTTFTTDTGCGTNTSLTGGSTAGRFALGANGPCTVVITMGNSQTAPTGWVCDAADRSVLTVLIEQSADSTTTASLGIPTGALSGNTISFKCVGY